MYISSVHSPDSQRYEITQKGLREAIHRLDNPLPNYRRPGAPANAAMLVSEKDVAARWPMRPSYAELLAKSAQ